MEIRGFQEENLDALVALQNARAPTRRHTSISALKENLLDTARGAGKNVRVAFERGNPQGFLAWVKGGGGELFGSPFLAASDEAARALVAVLLENSSGQSWVRVSAFPEETEKAICLQTHGFSPMFEFIEFESAPDQMGAAPVPEGILDSSVTTMPPAEFARFHNETFAGVDNSLPLDEEKAKEIFGSPLFDANLSRVWRRPSGSASAFSLVQSDGYLDAIGVSPAEQGKGLGTSLYAWILSRAARRGIAKVHTTVSSRNEASIRLHRRLAMKEVERRTVWQKVLIP